MAPLPPEEHDPSSFFFPNYEDPEVKGNYLMPTIVALMCLSGTIASLRIATRAWILRSLGADDWIIIPALLTAVGLSFTNIRSEFYGWGRHIWDIEPENWQVIRHYVFASQLLFTWSVALTKCSILIFYLRFCTTTRFRVAIWITFGLMVSWLISMCGLIVFQCQPVSNFWKLIEMHETREGCLPNEADLVLVHGIFSVVMDIVVLILPIPTVLRLSLPTKQKIGLISMFSLGLIVCAAGCLRLVNIRRVSITLDASWYGYDLWIYTSTEAHVAIMCASIPSLKPLVNRIFPNLSQTYATNSKGRTRTRTTGTPYNPDFQAHGDPKGYPLGSVIESRIESEESVYRGAYDQDHPMPMGSFAVEGVMKTTEIKQVVVHREEPFMMRNEPYIKRDR